MKTIKKLFCFALLSLRFASLSPIDLGAPIVFAAETGPDAQANPPFYLAIVIDDLGNNAKGTEEMLKLPLPITGAVMPHLPSSVKDAADFHGAGKGVILHMPMQSDTGKQAWIGKNPITTDLSPEQVRERVNAALDELVYAEGMNNHMGSTITQNEPIMEQIMDVLKERGLIMLDSRTTPKSKVGDAARKKNAKYLTRDIFLDGTQDGNEIEKNLRKAANIAKKKGYAIAIGHVGPWGGVVTAEAIRGLASALQEEGIQFVTLKDLYAALNDQKPSPKRKK
ncbi:MAG: divergent polysaccharide deacetylase family protein [Clostridiales bacterium]|nr:divergent polysaccharide deacetylase family protein [Clostridiales bacterium]